ncbi:MAG: sugar phosphate isomerase/epimerase [Pseudomonadota bacterium]
MRVWCVLVSLVLFSGCSGQANTAVETVDELSERPIGVQLWSVRDALAEDFEGTLRAIAEMGFDGVEFASDYGPYAGDGPGLRTFLDQLGLRASSAHVSFDMLSAESLPSTIEFFRALDVSLLIIGWDPRGWDENQIQSLVSDLNAASKTLAQAGMQIGYHNHAQEFGGFRGATFWDFIASNTNDNVVLQMDIGWVVNAGLSPMTLIDRYPGRIATAHYKVYPRESDTKSPIIGQDGLDWRRLTAKAIEVGALEWVVLEQEVYPDGLTSLESVAASKRGIDAQLE